jgi:hypothetical protein
LAGSQVEVVNIFDKVLGFLYSIDLKKKN